MTKAATTTDVFETAMGMERVGKDFYEALAVGSDDGQVRAFCARAASEEAAHLAAFRQMRDRWVQSSNDPSVVPSSDSDGLIALAKQHIQPDAAAVRKVAIGGSLQDALKLAMGMEQDSIRFYRGMLNHLPQSAQAIQGIVDEEIKHLSRLRMLAGLD